MGIIPKKCIPSKTIADSFLAKSGAAVLSPSAFGEIDDNNSVVHCIAVHPSYPQTAAHYTEAMAATYALLPAQPEPFLFSLLFLHFFAFFSFFIFLFPLGIYNEMMACNEKKKVTRWLWKQKGYSH